MVSGDRRPCFEGHGPQRGQSPPLSQLQQIVGGADHAPFRAARSRAPQQELAEAARLLDLPEHRFGQLLAQPVGAVVTASLDFLAHGLDARWGAGRFWRRRWAASAGGRRCRPRRPQRPWPGRARYSHRSRAFPKPRCWRPSNSRNRPITARACGPDWFRSHRSSGPAGACRWHPASQLCATMICASASTAA